MLKRTERVAQSWATLLGLLSLSLLSWMVSLVVGATPLAAIFDLSTYKGPNWIYAFIFWDFIAIGVAAYFLRKKFFQKLSEVVRWPAL